MTKQKRVLHGGTGTRLYRIWKNIKTRCYNQNFERYPDYGGRGIKMCDEWKSDFGAFRDWSMHHGYKDSLTIDRIDNDADYSPDNCRWATKAEQNRNKRNNRLLTCFGKTQSITAWEQETGIDHRTIYERLYKSHWPIEDALTVPPVDGGRQRLILFNGQEKSLSEWARELNISASTLCNRINTYGWPIERALSTPGRNSG